MSTTSTYRFVGSHTDIGDKKLTKFGQAVELEDFQFAQSIGTTEAPGAPILPASEFDAIGFTEQELSLYSDPYSHAQANHAFHEKKLQALISLHELRERVSQQ